MNDIVSSIMADLELQIRGAIESAYMNGFERGIASIRDQVPVQMEVVPSAFRVLNELRRITGIQDFRHFRRSRKNHLPIRWAAAVLLRTDAALSTTHVASILGYKDHTSVIHICERYAAKPEVTKLIYQVRTALNEEHAA